MTQKTPDLPSWHVQGFATSPEERWANGGEVVYRAFGGKAGVLGNCFFVPAVKAGPIGHWTAELLERELNASLWGNDFEGITKFSMIKGARYQIGPIAHDNYSGLDENRLFYQRAFFTPSGIFKQVKFVLSDGQNLTDCAKQMEGFRVSSGRYSREMSARAKNYRQ